MANMRWMLALMWLLGPVLPAKAQPAPAFILKHPQQVAVFDLCEIQLDLPRELQGFQRLPETQIHDAYDADRNDIWIRFEAQFSNGDTRLSVPGFAMRSEPGGAWQWRVRWSPQRVGTWKGKILFEGRQGPGQEPVRIEQDLPAAIKAVEVAGIAGPLVAPGKGQNPAYLRELRPDGTSRATWLFGACRAWVVNPGPEDKSKWAREEGIDRRAELFPMLRDGGYNLLNQWMAPWEYMLVHQARAEHWRRPDGSWQAVALPEKAAWTPYQCFDQGRARAFDELIPQCEGGRALPTIRLLFTPLPHQAFQILLPVEGGPESGWKPSGEPGRPGKERLNGFSAFRPDLEMWSFFAADPALGLKDWRSQLFDHQANFFRYVIARWGYSRAIGAWVVMDEIDAIGEGIGWMAFRSGWWAHPECEAWLVNTHRMFRGRLVRSDGLRYAGDPYAHPLHAATTSYGGQASRGANVEWLGGPADARPDLFGWHWYPMWPEGSTWTDAWTYTIAGVFIYSAIPLEPSARLISEFGAPDRLDPAAQPSQVYPTIYHHSIWAAIFAGQAGTPMDWDDGKEFGELRWRERVGAFQKNRYPVDNVSQLMALRRFLGDLSPDRLASCNTAQSKVRCLATTGMAVCGLHSTDEAASVYGWVYAPGQGARFTVAGLPAGRYRLSWHDPWTGLPIADLPPTEVKASEGRALPVDGAFALARLRAKAGQFPQDTRVAQGQDVAFKIEPVR